MKVNGKSENFSEKVPLVFYDSHGNEFEPVFSDVFEPQSGAGVNVNVEVFAKETVRIDVKGISDDVETEITPLDIEVYGNRDEIDKLNGKITISDFRLSSKEKGHKQELALELNEGVYLVDEKIVPMLKVTGVKNEEDN